MAQNTPSFGLSRLRLRSSYFPYILGLVVALYLARYLPAFFERILLYDDFEHLRHNSSWDGYLAHVFYSKDHFIPMLHTFYFLLVKYIPLTWIPAATSALIFVWVTWFMHVYMRLTRLLNIAPIAAVFGLAYAVINPMLAETLLWFCVSFYLAGLVVTLEALYQFLRILKSPHPHISRMWFCAFLAAVAPWFWTLGFLAGPLFVLALLAQPNKKAAFLKTWPILLVAFAFYPASRYLAGFLAHHEYTTTMAQPWDALKMTLKLIPDGLFLGAMGFWMRLDGVYHFSAPALNFFFALFAIYILWLRKHTTQQLALWIGLAFIFVGAFIPLLGRGGQISYEVLRYSLRYYTFPIFGMSIIVALTAQFILTRKEQMTGWLVIFALLFVGNSFATKNVEHYVGMTLKNGRPRHLRQTQVSQLALLERVFDLAAQLNISRNDLRNHFYIPVNGGDFHNGIEIYSGAKQPDKFDSNAREEISKLIQSADLWRSYQPELPKTYPPAAMFTNTPILPGSVSHLEGGVSYLVHAVPTPGQLQEFDVTEHTAIIGIPTHGTTIDSLWVDFETPGHAYYYMKVAFRYQDGSILEPSTHVYCAHHHCKFTLPAGLFPWFPTLAVRDVLLTIPIPEKGKIILHSIRSSSQSPKQTLSGL